MVTQNLVGDAGSRASAGAREPALSRWGADITLKPFQVAVLKGLLVVLSIVVVGSSVGPIASGHALNLASQPSTSGEQSVGDLSQTSSSLQQTPIPHEPEEYDPREVKAFYDWRNDLFFRHFDMEGGGRTDFMTARRTYKVWLNEFGTPVVLTMANPLFYWLDINNNGEFETNLGEMWADPEEDGVNGNEKPYDVHDLRSSGPPAYPFKPLTPRSR